MDRKKYVILFALLGFIVYLPAFLIEYGLHHDYHRWLYTDLFGHPESATVIVMGRPLAALLVEIWLYPAKSISDLAILRLIAFIFTLGYSLLAAWYFRSRWGMKPSTALLAAFSILTLPASQFYIAGAGNAFVFGSLNILLSFASYFILDGIGGFRSKAIRTSAALLVFISSFLIYPPTALAFLIFTFGRVVFSDLSRWRGTRRIVVRDVLFSAAGMAASYVLFMFLILPYLVKNYDSIRDRFKAMQQNPLYALSFAPDLKDKALLFYKSSKLALAGTLHLVFDDRAALAIFAFLLAGVGLMTYNWLKMAAQAQRREDVGIFLQLMSSVLILALIANAPMLVAKGSIVQYRVFFVYSAMTVIAVFWLFENIGVLLTGSYRKKIPVALMLIFAALSGAIALKNTYYTALNANTELRKVRARFAEVGDFSKISEIKFVTVPVGATFIVSDLKYEFKQTSLNNWVPLIPQSIGRAVLAEMGVNSKRIGVISYTPDERISVDDSVLVVDLNNAVFGGGGREIEKIMVAGSSEGSVPSRAFDLTLRSWRVTGYPQWIQVSFPDSKAVAEYEFICRPDAIPLRWEVFGSADGVNFEVVDRRNEKAEFLDIGGIPSLKGWVYHTELEEELWLGKLFVLERPRMYKHFRFVFSGGMGEALEITEILLKKSSIEGETDIAD